jgi:hypothetical protein
MDPGMGDRRYVMLPLLEYSAKHEQMLQEYYAQLCPQLEANAPWEDAHLWAICTGEIEVLVRETMHLYVNLLRADEFHHYCAVTQPNYPYVEAEHRLEELFTKLRTLLQQEIVLTEKVASHGYTSKGMDQLATCLREVELLLADESPVYTTEAFQALLAASFDDIKAGRIVGMTPEQL